MNSIPIIDAHAHFGAVGSVFDPVWTSRDLLDLMDRLGVGCAVASDLPALIDGSTGQLQPLRDAFEESGGRIYGLGTYHPGRAEACLAAMNQARGWAGLVGIKITPSYHGVPGEDPAYEPIWRFAADHGLPILTHSWSVSSYNPTQALSTPDRFEAYVRRFPEVRLVLGHAGGRGIGQREAIRMANEYPNVYMDFSGDIFCFELIERLANAIPDDRLMFGSDFTWLDPRANLSRVLLSNISDEQKARILCHNAAAVYKILQVPENVTRSVKHE